MRHALDPTLVARDPRGLTAAEALARRSRVGPNDILPPAPRGLWRLLAASLADPMLWFLLVSAGLFALVGEREEAVVLLLAIVPLFGMDAFLHGRTQSSTAALAARLAETADVVRDGVRQTLDSRDLVPGDRVTLGPGHWVPADGLLDAGEGVQVDESALSGESLPVRKQALPPDWVPAPSVAATHWLSAGTRLLTGEATLLVAATGAGTLYGELARSAQAVAQATTPLQHGIRRLTGSLLLVAAGLCLLLALVRIWQGFGWVDAVLAAITLAVAALPEEFPLVFAAFLGVGVYRLARRGALVRRAVAVENVGRITCLCTDKTGTLTEGRVELTHVLPAPGIDAAQLLHAAAGASGPEAGDPVDTAIVARAGTVAAAVTFPFTEARRRQVAFVDGPRGRHAVMKGAPETVLARCTMPSGDLAAWQARVAALAAEGHKVLACAEQPVADAAQDEPELGYAFLGLLGFEDPLRAGVSDAVAAARALGLRVIMLTGDHASTARAVAKELGLGEGEPRVREGDAVVADDAPLPDVVARCLPAQKLVLVQRLQARGERVAVTGDGINDVPALRAADVGIAMGERGTRAARDAAAIVLLDDDFATLVRAVSEGRQLFANLRASFAFLLLVHVPLVLTAAGLPFAGQPLPFLPAVVVLLELVIHPLALLAFQQGAEGQVPRAAPAGTRIFHREQVAWLLAGGLLATVAVCAAWFAQVAAGVELARSTAGGMLVALAVGSAAGLSAWRGRLARRVIASVAVIAFGLLSWPAAATVLGLAAPDALALLSWAGMGIFGVVLGVRLRHAPAGRGVNSP